MIYRFIGRVPVYDRALNLFAYELRPCSIPSQEEATAETRHIWETLRLESLTGGQTGLINMPAPWVKDLSSLPWPREKLILHLSQEALYQLSADDVNRLTAQGYLIAVGSERYDSKLAQDLQFAKFWALDVDTRLTEVKPELASLHARGVQLLARQINTKAQYETALEAGFDYFQGRYFEQPRLIHGTQLPANRIAILHLIARLQDPDVSIEEIEDLVSQDITLSYKLLRLINASFYGLPKRVDSLRRAVVFLGLTRIKHWATVILVNAIDYHPQELLITALVRARICEEIARQQGQANPEEYYIMGLFSLLDAIMDAPMQEILRHLNLADAINQALLYGSPPFGPILQTALSLEHGLCHKLPLTNLDLEATLHAYLEAIDWVEEIRPQILKQPKR
ncbi:EAL and HDOD domain-containing protein [Methylohalobius crimeensis]|uniref:EAL and HDOD domain-containing protein n=1 Tax=Methylohalobius crimeensis TaxID=244365 RepID=UPI0003B4B4A9|nr:HDOD domain-containing protein [Methylohalobius crimeensis]